MPQPTASSSLEVRICIFVKHEKKGDQETQTVTMMLQTWAVWERNRGVAVLLAVLLLVNIFE